MQIQEGFYQELRIKVVSLHSNCVKLDETDENEISEGLFGSHVPAVSRATALSQCDQDNGSSR
jgi:hypothetical protein